MAAKKSTKKSKVEIQNPDAPMTDKQTYKLYLITGVTMYYMDEYPYNIQEASDLIDRALNGEAYHVRVETAEWEGAKISWVDVGKQYRDNAKPKGYKTAMDMLGAPTAAKKKDEPAEEPEVDEPTPQKQGKTKYQRAQSLTAKYERELKALEAEEEAPPPAKVKKNKKSAKKSSETIEADGDLLTILSESFGIDKEKLQRMKDAFGA